MPSIAGYYATPDACRSWLEEHHPETLQKSKAVAGLTAIEITRKLVARGLDWAVALHCLPVPGSDPADSNTDGLIFARRSRSAKVYIPPRTESHSLDLKCKAQLEEMFGLTLSDWMTIYYDDEGELYIPELMSAD